MVSDWIFRACKIPRACPPGQPINRVIEIALERYERGLLETSIQAPGDVLREPIAEVRDYRPTMAIRLSSWRLPVVVSLPSVATSWRLVPASTYPFSVMSDGAVGQIVNCSNRFRVMVAQFRSGRRENLPFIKILIFHQSFLQSPVCMVNAGDG